MTVSLSKALKIKNRSISSIDRLKKIISENNSRLVGSNIGFDVRETYEKLKAETDQLIRVKAAISAANAPIQETIYRLAECKGRIAFLRGLSTVSGMSMGMYGMQQPVEYECSMSASEIEEEVHQLELEIDELQDVLDQHNANVKVELEL